jgi:hypothetical protein
LIRYGLPSAIQEACHAVLLSFLYNNNCWNPDAVINGKTGYLVDEYDIFG